MYPASRWSALLRAKRIAKAEADEKYRGRWPTIDPSAVAQATVVAALGSLADWS